MPSVMRVNIFNAFKTRLVNLGHQLSDSEIYALVDDAETQVAANANAQTDAQTDTGSWPDPTQAQT